MKVQGWITVAVIVAAIDCVESHLIMQRRLQNGEDNRILKQFADFSEMLNFYLHGLALEDAVNQTDYRQKQNLT